MHRSRRKCLQKTQFLLSHWLLTFLQSKIHSYSAVPETSYYYLCKWKDKPSWQKYMQLYFNISVKNQYIHRKVHRLCKGRQEKHLPSSLGTYILGSLHNESLNIVLLRTHLDFKLPIKSWRPISANTLKQNTVRISTSKSFLTDSTSEFTMTFRPRKIRCNNMEKVRKVMQWCSYMTRHNHCKFVKDKRKVLTCGFDTKIKHLQCFIPAIIS